MIRFSQLFAALDQTNSTNAKVEAMTAYFASAPAADAAWAVFFLTGRRLKRLVPGASIHGWTRAATDVDSWLLDECYAVVGDGAETAALILNQLPALPSTALSLADWVEDRILPLRNAEPEDQEGYVLAWVRELDRWQRLILFKLLTGELRLGVSQTLVVRALAQASNLPATTMAARLMGEWSPSAEWFGALRSPEVTDDDLSRPSAFYLAVPIEGASTAAIEGGRDLSPIVTTLLGNLESWLAEWKWDGIRAQLIKRAGRIHLWSRGEELITERFPEVIDAAAALRDGTVLDGEILAFRGDRPLPFSALQQRIGRQKQVARTARDIPVVFMAYDLLERDGVDIRSEPLAVRRNGLEEVVSEASQALRERVAGLQQSDESPAIAGGARGAARTRPRAAAEPLLPFEDDVPEDDDGASPAPGVIRLSSLVEITSWENLSRLRDTSRAHGVEGLMLKRRDSPYGVGRKRGDWWKWKIDPFSIDAVLIYAQPGSGKRASLLTDYTFGLWDNGELVPVAKAYSGLTNEEIAEMDRWIRRHTVQRFGPVRHVEPVHVFELGFEAIAKSTRHRSGVAVRFPRMLRWRKDKPASEADTLDALRSLIARP